MSPTCWLPSGRDYSECLLLASTESCILVQSAHKAACGWPDSVLIVSPSAALVSSSLQTKPPPPALPASNAVAQHATKHLITQTKAVVWGLHPRCVSQGPPRMFLLSRLGGPSEPQPSVHAYQNASYGTSTHVARSRASPDVSTPWTRRPHCAAGARVTNLRLLHPSTPPTTNNETRSSPTLMAQNGSRGASAAPGSSLHLCAACGRSGVERFWGGMLQPGCWQTLEFAILA
ncbi:hypothetical protein D9619_010952 [Psilocybe cf. subviscida]|uniref:Uncharacterized protein n=1 Tax=Psilocybe cf. subviscida TaxID=2480587 RepID=A0A8H5B8L3_9AGAR|nr:hypothetical protein D9619_010952 [Psilocybe cf. subviscida]